MNETISLFENDLNCIVDGNVMTNESSLSTKFENINTFLKYKGKVSCIRYFPLLKPTKP